MEKNFFPTTALHQTLTFDGKKDTSKGPKLNKSSQSESNRQTKPLSQRKIIRIDHKLSELKIHNQSMHKLIPSPIIKP
jgi:hypothetical protein